jgi:hypothetical protein
MMISSSLNRLRLVWFGTVGFHVLIDALGVSETQKAQPISLTDLAWFRFMAATGTACLLFI